MKKKRFNEIQIIHVLKEYAAGMDVTDLKRLPECCELKNFLACRRKHREFFIKMDFLGKISQEFNRVCGFLLRPVDFGHNYP